MSSSIDPSREGESLGIAPCASSSLTIVAGVETGRRGAGLYVFLIGGARSGKSSLAALAATGIIGRLAFKKRFAPIVDPRLRELDFGLLEGMEWDQLEETMQRSLVEFDDFAAPGGESATDLGERVESFLADLIPGDHLISTHGGVIRLLLRAAGQDEQIPPGHTVENRNAPRTRFWCDQPLLLGGRCQS